MVEKPYCVRLEVDGDRGDGMTKEKNFATQKEAKSFGNKYIFGGKYNVQFIDERW